jgi:hypothetical protein
MEIGEYKKEETKPKVVIKHLKGSLENLKRGGQGEGRHYKFEQKHGEFKKRSLENLRRGVSSAGCH